jgi:hypothetical protein
MPRPARLPAARNAPRNRYGSGLRAGALEDPERPAARPAGVPAPMSHPTAATALVTRT